jgi:hypothetical protein
MRLKCQRLVFLHLTGMRGDGEENWATPGLVTAAVAAQCPSKSELACAATSVALA